MVFIQQHSLLPRIVQTVLYTVPRNISIVLCVVEGGRLRRAVESGHCGRSSAGGSLTLHQYYSPPK